MKRRTRVPDIGLRPQQGYSPHGTVRGADRLPESVEEDP